MIQKIISGGQTGVDRAALDVAMKLGFICGGWCPKGRKAEDGTIDTKYPLKEIDSENYEDRTKQNIINSDGTLVLTLGEQVATNGTQMTLELPPQLGKPVLQIDMMDDISRKKFEEWIKQNRIQVLNVGGPRESTWPGKVYSNARLILLHLLSI